MALLSVIKLPSFVSLNRLLHRNSLRQIVKVMEYALVAACILCLYLMVAGLIASKMETNSKISTLQGEVSRLLQTPLESAQAKKPQLNYSTIVEKNIFGPIGVKPTVAPAVDAKPLSSVPLNLVGVFLYDGESPYAIIEEPKKQNQEVFNVGDSIFEVAKLTKIYSDRVEIERDGKTEVLQLDTVGGGGSAGGGAEGGAGSPMVIDEKEVDAALSNLPLLMTQARAVPYFKDGQSVGLRLFAIKPGSIFDKIGLLNGDVLKSVNGSSLGDLTQAVKLFERLKEERSITVVLERRNAEQTLSYHIR